MGLRAGAQGRGENHHLSFLAISCDMEKNTFFAITDKGKDRVSHRSKAGVTASSFCLGISALKVLGEPLMTARRPHSLSPGSAFFFLIARRPPNASDIYCLSPPPATPQAGILFGFPAVSPGPRTALALSRPSINSCLGPTHDCMHILSPTSPRGGPGRDWHHSQGAGERGEDQGQEPGWPEGRRPPVRAGALPDRL